jgi:hypothetical protein
LKILGIRIPNAVLVNARPAQRSSRPRRSRCDFARSFTHHFWCHFGGQFGPLFEAPLERRFACIWTFPVIGVLVGTRFRTTFGPYFCPCFPALGNPTMLPAVPKFLGRYFAHPEQECPSGKGSFRRKVNKARKAGIHESRIPFSAPVWPYFGELAPLTPTYRTRMKPSRTARK